MSVLIANIGRLFTATERGTIENASVLVSGDRIAWVGASDDALASVEHGQVDHVVDAGGALVTPGLIDAHTHPMYAEPRLREVAARSAGSSYQGVASAGGGIASTVRSTRAASWADLARATAARLRRSLLAGTTTVEAKTGYWLSRDGELAAIRQLVDLGSRAPPDERLGLSPAAGSQGPGEGGGPGALPRIEVTFLAAHDVPPERRGHDDAADACVADACGWSTEAARAGARFVDVFCDQGYFSVEQARRVLAAGRAAGLLPRLHADELAHTGGALLAAEVGAVSADHLLRVGEHDAVALAEAGVVATLCPPTALAMGVMPPARMLVDHGVTLALGSDHNPGQSGVVSMSLVVGLAVHLFGLSVEEALLAATAGGAASVAAPDRGAVTPGLLADLVSWEADHEGVFAWDLGVQPRWVMKGGQRI